MNLDNVRYFNSSQNIALFIRVAIRSIYIKILLNWLALPKLLPRIEPTAGQRIDPNKIELIVKLVNFMVYDVFRSKTPCLDRSLILFRYLKMAGLDLKIAFAVKKSQEAKLAGHAWLIYNDQPFLEHGGPSQDYHVMFIYPNR
jgi:hypothetical protein